MSLIERVYNQLSVFDVALAFLGLFVFCSLRAKLTTKRGPTLWPVVGSTPDFFVNINDVYGWITRSLTKHRGTFFYRGFWFDGSFGAVTGDPANVEYMLKTNFNNFPKGSFFKDRFRDLLEDGIFNTDGESWKEQRRIIITEMHSTGFIEHSFQTTERLVKKKLLKVMDSFAKSQEVFDLQDVLLRLTFDNICIAGLGDDPETLELGLPHVPFAKSFDEATEYILFRFMIPNFIWKPMRFFDVGYEKCLRQCTKVVHGFVDKMIVDRICKVKEEKLDKRSDVLTKIIQVESLKNGNAVDPDTIRFYRQFCTSFILAGRDTSAVALSWFLWVIQKHPEVEKKIINEIREILRQRSSKTESLFTIKELNNMVYLQAAISETLRLYPPIPMEMKQPIVDDVFPDGTFIQKGSRIYISIIAMGRLESIWGKDCEMFRPERWIHAGQYVSEGQFKYVVFNGGPRMCLGKTFAHAQMKIVAASLLLRYSIKLVQDHVVVPRVTTSLYMKYGLKVSITPRSLEEMK